MEGCPVCDGTGRLLLDVCPLCDGLPDQSPQEAPAAPPRSPKTGRGVLRRLCLVLDIDGTLLSEGAPSALSGIGDMQVPLRMMLRPHLQAFLDFAFESCVAVGIWTAASSGWMDLFFRIADPERKRPWAFTWCGNMVGFDRTSTEGLYPVYTKVKKLSKIWRNRALRARGYTRHSTLIIDNTPSVCRRNYGNAIYIKTYGDVDEGHAAIDSRDDHLLVLQTYLRQLHDMACAGQSMCFVEKRGWYWRVKHGADL